VVTFNPLRQFEIDLEKTAGAIQPPLQFFLWVSLFLFLFWRAGVLPRRSMACLDLLGSAFFGFSLQFFRALTFGFTFCATHYFFLLLLMLFVELIRMAL
jgi:hypothetical protein